MRDSSWRRTQKCFTSDIISRWCCCCADALSDETCGRQKEIAREKAKNVEPAGLTIILRVFLLKVEASLAAIFLQLLGMTLPTQPKSDSLVKRSTRKPNKSTKP